MAVTKIWTIKDSLQRVLDYAANPDKTEYDALAQTLHYAENDAKTKLNESAQLVTGMQRFGRGMADEPCGFIGWEKNTIYLP